MSKTAEIINLLEGLTAEEIAAGPGASGQVQVIFKEDDREVEQKFVDTAEEAELLKNEWE
tara:strand:+ start:469 stop:648 length:180 start_codon:yes stop_codon:yes gene_type:complete